MVFLFSKPFKSFAQVNVQDSLALVSFYDSTDGKNWSFIQWDLTSPVKYWQGIRVENNRVTGIELRGAFKSGRIPASFGNLTALTSIYLLDCRLDNALPESFGNLTNLAFLKLSAIFYNPVPFPTCITKLTKLTALDLSTNHFSNTSPIFLGDLSELRSLDLSYSTIGGKIPLGLENLKKLNTLILNSSEMSGTIPESIGDLDSLSYLDLNGNHLSGAIPTAINNLKNLTTFNLFDNNYTFQGLEPFVQNYTSKNSTYDFEYSPQGTVLINQHHEKLGVSAGGTLANNTYKWYKINVGLVTSISGDSTFTPTSLGEYYTEITNSIATNVTLTSRSTFINVLLENETTTVLKNITGTDTTYINDGFFKIASLKPIEGPNALKGNVSTTVTIVPTVPTFNSQPYVQRHYDISPVVNETNAQAVVTLYFTQQEFVNYNNYVTTNNLNFPLLPSQGVDNGNVRITQFHGNFTGSSQPGNYTGGEVLIIPTVKWDLANNWWVVTFPVSGFSGFYISTANSTLPLTLLDFHGNNVKNSIVLKWQTSDELNTSHFIVQRSDNGMFSDIGAILSYSLTGINNYAFTDENPVKGKNLYRLKMIDANGHFSFSKVIKINFSHNLSSLGVYPNPATKMFTVKIISEKAENINLKITDVSGKLVYQKRISVNAGENLSLINIEKLSVGLYYLAVNRNGQSEKVSFVKE